ncbi:sensor histidine kinase [Streptomyces sp. H27-D2]|uniref:sensor histidine kinase n=1 Tax=Streptomyces sp. H27-D2 TaxID=3046304 RepID=UPI002DBD7C13|nr:ATP-binding protein [Streptomyces sp. H27-D2]MEC4019819.1 ATP-binding protein [Streptomyces sp. H27-D2]
MPDTASERRPLVRWSARLRLTLLYGLLFLISGAVLLGFTYILVARSPVSKQTKVTATQDVTGDPSTSNGGEIIPDIEHLVSQQHEAELQALLTESGIALGVMTAVSVALGWLMAGRVLRPVSMMADKARRISERNLHERLAVSGSADELKDLGDTFDGLLARLDAAFDVQKRFVANASHELRTPLTLQRAMIEVELSAPAPDVQSLRAVCERVLAAGESQERLIEALLTLASSERGLQRREPLDLCEVTADVVRERCPDTPANGLRIETALGPAHTYGDAGLVERLATNLIENALRYTHPGGWIRVATGMDTGRPALYVANSGPQIPPDRIPVLFQPFQRLESRVGSPDGHGLGLSIVAAIATAHDARITAVPGREGGLTVTVAFPHQHGHQPGHGHGH